MFLLSTLFFYLLGGVCHQSGGFGSPPGIQKVIQHTIHLVFSKCSGALSSAPAGGCHANNARQ